jgi:D-alanine-D-alanine ligase
MAAAVQTYHALGCDGLCTVDLIVQERQPFVLECNTIPGMTEESPLVLSAERAGVDVAELVRAWLAEFDTTALEPSNPTNT